MRTRRCTGARTSNFDRPLFATELVRDEHGKGRGITRIGDARFDTTGGSASRAGWHERASRFPAWATIPGPRSLALGRRWHFFFGWRG
jgi:thiosulfate reductase cytochrome b subunit